jgi:DNA-binding XRE family transcriptional regulator
MEHPLRTYRIAAGLSLDALATRANVNKATLSRIENRQCDPSLALVRVLMGIFPELRADDFITLTGPTTVQTEAAQ